MVAEMLLEKESAAETVSELVAQSFSYTVQINYPGGNGTPAISFSGGPPSDTTIVQLSTASITLQTSITGLPPTGATATFTSTPLSWSNAGGTSILQPSNIGSLGGVDTATLTIPISSNPATETAPVIVNFTVSVSCTCPSGIGSITLSADPTIVYVQGT